VDRGLGAAYAGAAGLDAGAEREHVLIGADAELMARARASAGTRIGWVTAALDAGAERVARDLAADFLFVHDRLVAPANGPLGDGPWDWVIYDVATRARARERIVKLREDKRALEEKLANAEKGLELHEANEQLKARVDELEGRVEELTRRNAQLGERDRKMWFAVGAGVLLGGMLLGIVIKRIPWRSRRDRLF